METHYSLSSRGNDLTVSNLSVALQNSSAAGVRHMSPPLGDRPLRSAGCSGHTWLPVHRCIFATNTHLQYFKLPSWRQIPIYYVIWKWVRFWTYICQSLIKIKIFIP